MKKIITRLCYYCAVYIYKLCILFLYQICVSFDTDGRDLLSVATPFSSCTLLSVSPLRDLVSALGQTESKHNLLSGGCRGPFAL